MSYVWADKFLTDPPDGVRICGPAAAIAGRS